MVYCDEDPFRTDCMRAVMRRLKAMMAKRPDVPTIQERLEAVERLEQVAQELRTVIGNTKPIDCAKAYELAKIDIERQEASDEED
jgi:hypothetical protein